jgi:hypothetical protein
MMDDPVTHFDDLNTYALLDLILGLQGSPEGERQFIISTFDEKLLHHIKLSIGDLIDEVAPGGQEHLRSFGQASANSVW